MPTGKSTISALIPLRQNAIGTDTIQTVNARDLHAFLGVKQRFNDWVSKRIGQYGFLEGVDFTRYYDSSSGNPTPPIDYFASIDMAKELSMVEKTAKGKEARLYFISCEKELHAKPVLPTLHDPVSQALMQIVIEHDATKYRLSLVEAQQAITDTKADMALDEAHRMTLEEFVVKNGLLRQFPESQWPRMAKWLTHFCQQYNLAAPKVSVAGKSWDEEKSYPLQALAALQRYELKKPRQAPLALRKGQSDGEGVV